MAPFKELRTRLGLRKIYLGKHVHIGRHTYGLRDESITEAKAETPVVFGKFCSVSTGVLIIADVHHAADRVSTYPIANRLCGASREPPVSQRPLVVGNDVWIERRAILLPGITVGDGAVIVAGAVVGEDVPPYAIVEGSPAKLLRYRCAPEIIEKMLAIRWWDWSDEKIRAEQSFFYGPVEDFVARHAS